MPRPRSILLCFVALTAVVAQGGTLAYNRDVRPILSDKCFRCHGPDAQARKAGLRLDVRAAALREKDGVRSIVPGNAGASEVIRRVESADPEERMPPPESHLSLKRSEAAILRQWIAEGAAYQPHWAFVPPTAMGPPAVKDATWAGNALDRFVLGKLESANLHPSPRADQPVLLRRVTLDLTGLPPTLDELDAFAKDTMPGAYERVVDRLLAAPQFGERMAVDWLDAARYADTNGYFGDRPRSAWPWRDWVIAAFNANMPFDQFTIEQLAGDLLPDATRDQRVATGFCRNSMANDEGGLEDEEYRVEFIIDRLDAISNTWMGLSVGCAQCHDHKYDPITQREFYQLFAFFNNTPEVGHIKPDVLLPAIPVPSRAQELEAERLKAARIAAVSEFKRHETDAARQIAAWGVAYSQAAKPAPVRGIVFGYGLEAPAATSRGFTIREIGTTVERVPGLESAAAKFDGSQHIEVDGELGLESDKPWSIAVWMKGEEQLSCVLSKVEAAGLKRGVELIWLKGALQVNLVHRWGVDAIEVVTTEPLDRRDWNLVVLSYDGSRKAAGVKLSANGVELPLKVNRDSLHGTISNAEPLRLGRRDANLGYYGLLDEVRVMNRVVPVAEAAEWFWSTRVRSILSKAEKERPAREKELVLDYFMRHVADATMRTAHEAVKRAKTNEIEQRKRIPTALVMQENVKPRATYVLARGQWNVPADPVQADVPAVFPRISASENKSRLGFARWLVSPENPLTSRVIVNRLWQQCFGEGLVRTVNDFGSQGEAPTHPELLDWLAVRFMRSGWDVKAMLRFIVTSETYQQRSRFTVRDSQLQDPENRMLARGPSFRLGAEALRDQALAVAGLLAPRIGGPSVMPWQPPGVWEAVSYNAEESYVPDRGEGLWRRTLYSYWKRQAPPPALLTFDGPTREKCNVRRARTNTPLQALVLLNDENHVTAAAALGARAAALPLSDRGRVACMFRAATSRPPDSDELRALVDLLKRQTQRQGSPWTVVAQTILNLDEVITRR